MKRHKIKRADRRVLAACIEELQALVDGLKAGSIGVEADAERVELTPAGEVEFELRIDQQRRKEIVRIEMSWRRDDVPSTTIADGAPETAATGVAHAESANGSGADVASANGSLAHGALPEGAASPVAVPSSWFAAAPAYERERRISNEATDRMATAEYRRLYDSVCVLGSDGHWHIDQDRLVVSLAAAGVDPLTQQELYALALQADADGRASMLSERFIDALERVSQLPALPD